MQFDPRMRRAQGWPFGRRFLHPVLAKHPLPGRNQRPDRGGIVDLADRDQRHLVRAARDLGGSGDTGTDIIEGSGWIDHGALL